MGVHVSTKRHIDDHLGHAEFALKVVVSFRCLQDTPAHAAVREALSQVAKARRVVHEEIIAEKPKAVAIVPAIPTPAERARTVHRRMARLAP